MVRFPSLSTLLALLILSVPAAAAPPPEVVVTVRPLHALVSGVMAGVGQPHLLVPGAASPHAFALRPSDAKALRDAALIVWAGPSLETFMEKPLRALGGDARQLMLLEAAGINTLPVRQGGVWDHGHDRDHNHDHDHGHEEGAVDGHLWLDPRNAVVVTRLVAAELGALDPARAATYQANADRQVAVIEALDREIEAALAPVRERPFIVFHDAYHYLEDRYRLNAAGAITVSPDQRPGAARLKALRQTIREAGALCVFAEPQFEPTLVRTLVEGTGARTGVLDPEGANLPDGPDFYPTLMRFNAMSLVDCLSGG